MHPEAHWLNALPTDRLLAEMSLWSAELGHLVDEIERVDALTDIYHIDVADGHFSPALLFFPDLVAICRKSTKKPLHVHLMVSDAILQDQIKQFADAGADLISIHAENSKIEECLSLIEDLGLISGIVLQLHTPVAAVAPYLDRISVLTLLGTRIGIKGQGLDEQAGPRLREAKSLIAAKAANKRILLAADGGIREHTVPGLRRAGAETIVMGSLAFNADHFEKRMVWVRAQPEEA
ncbi:ribulose-phosphate 3-epimerase [Rhizobium sp. 2YAF20]|uniref:ribulose-phosphate 3-epimerase n=1 Tax=Rhizobium sp. 2YAF20 TaxID=3233027 RepID=UPI003F99EE97